MNEKPVLHHLKNGLSVILVPQKGATSMTLLVLTKVGSRYETKEINGASHFIEHLMFKGTKRRPDAASISRVLDRYGASYNAYTDKDLTGYYIKMDADKTALAVDMLHDMLFHSKYDAKEINRERGVIVEEINMYEDNPQAHIDDLIESALFPDSTLGWEIAGPREVIKKVTRKQLVDYRDAFYTPSRMCVVVAGKVDANILDLLRKTFGEVKESEKQAREFLPFAPPVKLNDPIRFQDKATEQVQFGMAFYGVKMAEQRQPAANLLGAILGSGMSSRLFTEIRERRGLCYSIYAGHSSREDIGMFSVMAGLEKNRVPEAVKAIVGELKKVLKSGVTAEELRRAKDQMRGRLMLSFEDSATRAEWYGRQWIFQNKLETPEERLKLLEKVTAKQIQNVAKEIFVPERMAAAVIGPFGSKERVEKFITW